MRFGGPGNEAQVIELFRRRMHTRGMEIMPGIRGQGSIAMSLALILVGLASARPASAGQPSPETAGAFGQYIESKDAADRRTFSDLQEFLKIDGSPEVDRNENYARLRRGDILI